MAISGIQQINIGLANESIGSDSLFLAFNKTANNFANLFACASPFNTFTGNTGITLVANASVGTLDIQNSGVTNIIAGTGVSINQANGNVTISSTGSGGGAGTVTSVGLAPVSTSRLVVTNTPIVSSGIITIDLATSGVGSGTYTYPTLTVDSYGRITSIANAASVGTVTSVGAVAGSGIQVSGGPITTAGSLTIVNTGVTSLTAGTGIQLSSSNGSITVSTVTTGGTVSSIVITSSSLDITNGTITTTGVVDIELPANVSVTGKLLLSGSENLGSGNAASLTTTASYFTTSTASTATLAAGTTGQIKTFMMVADGGDMVITVSNAGWKTSGTGTITFGDIGDGCTLQYINSKWYCIGQNGVAFG
jgi:hypothetical protein